MQRDEYLRMLLAGTVTFPATFPEVGRLELCEAPLPLKNGAEPEQFLTVTESTSPRVTLIRRVSIQNVRAVFLPNDPKHVDYSQGEWLLADEIASTLKNGMPFSQYNGIAFVHENAPSLLDVSVGMTAAESIQYYPPLPGDLSRNHYNPSGASGGESDSDVGRTGCY
jgi:hypothetical protein